MAKIHLRVIIPSNRDFNGIMTVFVDDMETTSFPVIGRGSRGKGIPYRYLVVQDYLFMADRLLLMVNGK